MADAGAEVNAAMRAMQELSHGEIMENFMRMMHETGPTEGVIVDLGNGVQEEVRIGKEGPLVLQPTFGSWTLKFWSPSVSRCGTRTSVQPAKWWHEMTVTERTVLLNIVAKKNRSMKQRLGIEV
mmetsp:Transcript_158115/g.507309  ORF Transcript_158115/g.507309 Transcript_158115/m.507309 type:complete len:124 (+) Transcript_158115:78-449(+)